MPTVKHGVCRASRDQLEAPFPYFGSKSSVAADVWAALGQPKHYLEAFFGSGAVLLARPGYQPGVHIETVNDKDGHVSNCWRALQAAPDEVARWCDWPVNHADLMARKAKLISQEANLLEHLAADDTWFDAKLAGYWIWAASCWIGSGLTRPGQRPHLSNSGTGVHKLGQRPHLSNSGTGVHKLGQRPHLSDGGKGVHRLGKKPQAAEESKSVQEPYNMNIYAWFRALSERLRYVRVVCGDWTRICGGDWQDANGTCGIFFDPPYGVQNRDANLYQHDSLSIATDVREWCLERGGRRSYHIVLTGYYEEHESLLEQGWSVKRWKAKGGYSNTRRQEESQGSQNRFREALFFSPHCLKGMFA